MKAPVKLYLISPREPCGATWLINCFLTLGIKTYRKTVNRGMWLPVGDSWRLNPDEEALKKWLPALSEKERFHFRDDIEIEWAHFWPTGKTRGSKIIYFIRDPRDALLSRYKREAPQATYKEFLDFPDCLTLLDRLDTWNLFNESWLSQPKLKFFRFEDYKVDPRKTLGKILHYAGIEVEKSEAENAVMRSSFEAAVKAEREYRERHPEDTQIINRASQIGSWKELELTNITSEINNRCGLVMSQLGYEEEEALTFQECSYLPHSRWLRVFQTLDVSEKFWSRSKDDRELVRSSDVLLFIQNLSCDLLDAHHIGKHERWQLLTGLRQFIKEYYVDSNRRLEILLALSLDKPGIAWRINDILRAHGIQVPSLGKAAIQRLLGLVTFVGIGKPK